LARVKSLLLARGSYYIYLSGYVRGEKKDIKARKDFKEEKEKEVP